VVQGNKRLLLGVVRPLGGTEPPEGAVMHARADELYEVGTLGTVVRMLKLGDGSVRVMVQGLERAAARRGDSRRALAGGGLRAAPQHGARGCAHRSPEAHRARPVLPRDRHRPLPGEELHEVLVGITEGGKLADFVAANLDLALPARPSCWRSTT